ncbi:hypothetical protein NKI04_25180 [Mesorhizobium sp. M0814]|uniref:hypothetical protein n=1 Tax=Mesorhizobium sp. M0814 TaxID=2957004 RepID=UPI00333DF5D3
MLDFYFSYRRVLKRLRSGALGGEMDRLAEHFFMLGYKPASAKIYLSRIARFSQFAGPRSGPMPIHQDVIDSYLCTFTTDTPRIGAVSALGHARRVAPERFIGSVPSVADDPTLGALGRDDDGGANPESGGCPKERLRGSSAQVPALCADSPKRRPEAEHLGRRSTSSPPLSIGCRYRRPPPPARRRPLTSEHFFGF